MKRSENEFTNCAGNCEKQSGEVASAMDYLLRLVESQDLQLNGCEMGLAEHPGMTMSELLRHYSEESVNFNDVVLEIKEFPNDTGDALLVDSCFSVASYLIELSESLPEDWERSVYIPCPVPDNFKHYLSLARENAESCSSTLDFALSGNRLLAFMAPPNEEYPEEKFIIVLNIRA